MKMKRNDGIGGKETTQPPGKARAELILPTWGECVIAQHTAWDSPSETVLSPVTIHVQHLVDNPPCSQAKKVT